MPQVVVKWVDADSGEIVDGPTTIELSLYRSENPSAPAQYVILDDIKRDGMHSTTNHSVRVEITKARKAK